MSDPTTPLRTADLAVLAAEEYAYLTTRGRRSGRSHEIEIWFAVHEGRVYMLAGGGDRADWVRNLRADPAVTLRIAGRTGAARASVVADAAEGAAARPLLAAKYQGWREGQPLSEWARTALPVGMTLGA